MVRLSLCLIILAFVGVCSSLDNNLESSDDEDPKDAAVLNYSTLENPFRVQKINLLWEKARFVNSDLLNAFNGCSHFWLLRETLHADISFLKYL